MPISCTYMHAYWPHIYMYVATNIHNHGSKDSYNVNFEEIENVYFKGLNDDEFQMIKNVCIVQANESSCGLFHRAPNNHCLFHIFPENKLRTYIYSNWIRSNFLEIIPYECAHVDQHLKNLINNKKAFKAAS